jgi:hypothetical protein
VSADGPGMSYLPDKGAMRSARGAGILLRVTYDAIAVAVGLSRYTVQRHATGARRLYDPHNLASVAAYVAARAPRSTP